MHRKHNPLTPFSKGEFLATRWLVAVFAAITIGSVLFALPLLQQTAPDIDIATLLPPGVMIYLESRDLLGQLQRWSDSGVKQRWLVSANLGEFEKSRLYLRLKDRLQEFNSLAGL